jgi:DNA-binding MarR family transcriptional regulator
MPRASREVETRREPSVFIRSLYGRPGFLLWRAHHIAVSVFNDECGDLGITSPQYGALCVVREIPGVDQGGVSRLAGLDRFTTALVLANLRKRRLIVRERDVDDRRRYSFRISSRGLALLRRARKRADRGRDRLLSPFTPRERKTLIALLTRLVVALNKDARARIDETALPRMRRSGRAG